MPQETKTIPGAGAKTASGTLPAVRLDNDDELAIELAVTAVSGTTPTLVCEVEWSFDGTTFSQSDPADVFTQVTTAVRRVKLFKVKAPFYRIAYTIGGTTPSFTFTAKAYTS